MTIESGVREIIENYRLSIGSYRQFLETLNPFLDELPEKDDRAFNERLDRAFEPFKRTATSEDMKEFARVARALGVIQSRDDTDEAYAETRTDEVVSSHLSGETSPETLKVEVSGKVANALFALFRATRAHVTVHDHREMLHRGVLTGLVGQFEVLISDLAHFYYRMNPAAIRGSEKTLSVEELFGFPSLEAVKESIVSARVDDLLRGSADDWADFFQKRLKLELKAMATDWDRFVERVQRRHLIVHAGSRISRRYLEKVSPEVVKSYFEDATVGTPVDLSAEYVQAALSDFETTGLLLGFSVWAKLIAKQAKDQSNMLAEVVYESLRDQKWDVALSLANWGRVHKDFDENTRLVCRMNMWLALKRLGRFHECREEILRHDCSALSWRFRLVRLALLDETQSFFASLESGGGADLDDIAWDEWPVFDELRLDERYLAARVRFLGVRHVNDSPAHKQAVLPPKRE